MKQRSIGGQFLAACVIPILIVLYASTARADDPFAPPGTVLIRMPIPSRQDYTELQRMGLQPEEAGRHEVDYRVTAQQLERIIAMGLPYRLVDAAVEGFPSRFTSYSQMVDELKGIASSYPQITALSSCGLSVQGRDIMAMKISDNPGLEEAEPEVRSIGAHHGNEQMSTEINLNLIHYLVENYGTNPTVTNLVNDLEIWVVPMMNPDGYTASSRYNAHGVDLNRNYGYMWQGGSSGAFSEPETRAILQLSTENWFSLSLSFHCSGDVVNSVWNYTPIYSEDDDVVVTLSNRYAAHNGYWAVRGWYWYETHGDCNDWSYGARADMDWTIETDNYNETAVWNENRDAILEFFQSARWGIHGVVTDAVTGEPLRARVWVEGNGWPAFTDPAAGDYHKPLLAGTYALRFAANGYQEQSISPVTVPSQAGVTVNVQMTPGGGRYADRVDQARVEDPNNSYDNLTLTMSALGAPDSVGCSLGKGGSAVLDLGPGSEAQDDPGDDLIVYESAEDAPGEGFTLYLGSTALGPWTSIGTGSGTTSFDLASAGVSSARYVRIQDDNDGNPDDPHAGFDLDAVEVLRNPAAVTDLVSTLADSLIHLSWSAVTIDVDGKSIAVAHYVIYRSDDPHFSPQPTDSLAVTADTFFDDPTAALQDTAINHYYSIVATEAHGRRSSASIPAGEFDRRLGSGERASH